ncbi:MAG: ligand-binding sensor domain-containing protein [Candidatus Muiribacteriota bacterium]
MKMKNLPIFLLTIFILLTGCSQNEASEEVDLSNDDNEKQMVIFNTRDGLADNFISSILVEYIDGRETIWIGTWKGLVKFDTERWITYTTSDGLAQNHITDIAKDANENLWTSSISLKANGGISVLEGLKWKSHTTYNKEPFGNIICMFKDSKNRLWAGSWGNGIYMQDENSWHNYNIDDGIPANEIMDITEFGGNIWFATKFNGAFYFNNENKEELEIEIINEHSTNLINNSICTLDSVDDEIWLGTWGGVSVFDGSSWQNYTSWDDRLADNFVRTLLATDEKVYFGTDKGLTILHDRKKANLTENWETFTTTDGLPSNKILSIADSVEHIWVGTDHGLVKLEK